MRKSYIELNKELATVLKELIIATRPENDAGFCYSCEAIQDDEGPEARCYRCSVVARANKVLRKMEGV